MAGETTATARPDPAFDIIGTRRGIVGGVVGIADWDVSRMREAREIVLYDFGGRQQAFDGCVGLHRAQDMRVSDVDKHFHPGCTVILGEGEAPPPNAPYPIKIRVLAPDGFTHDNIRTFERCVELIEDEAWGERPPVRTPAQSRAEAPESEEEEDGEDEDEVADAVPTRQRRLGAAPRLEPEQRGPNAKPKFQVPVTGFTRKLPPGHWGSDEFGNPTQGSTYVRGHDRYTKQPPRPPELIPA